MSDNQTTITANLDLSKAQAQMSQFLGQNYQVSVNVDTSSITNLQNELSSAVKELNVAPNIESGNFITSANSMINTVSQVKNTISQLSELKPNLD